MALGEMICHYGLKYLEYADDTQLYFSTPSHRSDNVGALLWCLEAVGINGGQQALTESWQDWMALGTWISKIQDLDIFNAAW